MSDYYIAVKGKRHGPFSSTELRAMAAAGQITRTDMVWKEGWTRWAAVGEVKGVFPPPLSYWLLVAGRQEGPHKPEQIRARLASGELTPRDLACPEGGSAWLPLSQYTDFQWTVPLLEAVVQPAYAVQAAPSGPQPVAFAVDGMTPPETNSSTASPWNPVAILVLGVLFSPVWTGIMAGINGRRLGLGLPAWRPIAIGVGSLVLDLSLSMAVSSMCFDLLLYLGALVVIWLTDLRPQFHAYQQPRLNPAQGNWLVPILSGAPVAFVSSLVLVASFWDMVRPLEPKEVCQRLNDAKSIDEAKKYATINLWPALEALLKVESKDEGGYFELTDEAVAPEQVGGYLVGFRMVVRDGKEQTKVDGLFHLVYRDEAWKVEELYFTHANQQELTPWLAMSRDYSRFLPATLAVPPPIASRPPPAKKSWWDDPKNQKTAMKAGGKTAVAIGASAEGKGFMKKGWAIVVAICVGIGAFLKSRFGTKETTKTGA